MGMKLFPNGNKIDRECLRTGYRVGYLDMREKVDSGWRRCKGNQIKENEVNRTCSMHGYEKCIQNFS
jgi:hypothetical protein